MRFARWAAVSTRDQAKDEKFSIPIQLERTQTESLSRGWQETAGPFICLGQSRTKYIQLHQAEREIEALRMMLQCARAGEFEVLVMTEFDRLRELLDQVFRTLARYRVQLYSLAQPIDLVPPDQYDIYKADSIAMMIGMSQIISRQEISRTRRKWNDAMPKRITELGLPATHIPFGYRKPRGHETDRKAIPEPDPILARHLMDLKDLHLSGHSTTQLIDYLDDHHITPPKGMRWHPQTVRDILRNPFYAGIVRFGVSRVYLDPLTETRKRNRRIPPNQVHENFGKHQPLWDVDTRNAIIMEYQRRTRSYRGRVNNQLTGLVKCGICGASMWRQGNGPRSEFRLIWRCSSPNCSNTIPHSILIEKVGAALVHALHPHMATLKITEPKQDNAGFVEQTIKELHTMMDRLEMAYLSGQWNLDRYATRKADIDRQIMDAQLAQVQAAERPGNDQEINPVEKLEQLPIWFATNDTNATNRAVQLLIDSVTVSTATVELGFK